MNIQDAPLKLVLLKEIKKLTQKNQVLIKNGKWKIKPKGIKPYEGTFTNSEGTSAKELPKYKTRKSANIIYMGCAIISVAAIGVLFIWSQSTILLW